MLTFTPFIGQPLLQNSKGMEERMSIVTTQNVGIEYEIASLGDRYVAGIIDVLAIFGYMILFLYMADQFYFNDWTYYVFLLLPLLLYDLVLELILDGQSLGKYLMRLKVVNTDGSQVSVGGYLLRWLLRPVDVWISMGGVAVLSIIITGTGQRLGDLAAGTTVINLKNRVKLTDTLFTIIPDGYETVFQQSGNLTDKDVALIKEIIDEANWLQNNKAIELLAIKVAGVMQVQHNLPSRKFLETVLRDYNHLHAR